MLCIAPLSLLGGADSSTTKSVYKIKLHWIPQAEFAGFYVAEEDHLFEKAGVQVVIDHSTFDEDFFDALKKGETDIVVSWTVPSLLLFSAGEDVVNIGQISCQSSLMLIARKKAGISKLSDISGHRVGLWVSPTLRTPLQVLLNYEKVKDYKILPVLDSVDLFLYGGVDVIPGTQYDEYYRLYASGIEPEELVCFSMSALFPDMVDLGLFCKRETYMKDPDACLKIRDSILKGWHHAFDNRPRALGVVKKVCEDNDTLFDIAIQRWMLDAMEKDIFPTNKMNSGILRRESFDQTMKILGKGTNEISYEDFVLERREVRQ